MAKCDNLLEKARGAPAGLSFAELCLLAECFGFEFARQKGSHRIYKRPGYKYVMNFQPDGKMAKRYQVRQLVRAIDEIRSEEDEKQSDAE